MNTRVGNANTSILSISELRFSTVLSFSLFLPVSLHLSKVLAEVACKLAKRNEPAPFPRFASSSRAAPHTLSRMNSNTHIIVIDSKWTSKKKIMPPIEFARNVREILKICSTNTSISNYKSRKEKARSNLTIALFQNFRVLLISLLISWKNEKLVIMVHIIQLNRRSIHNSIEKKRSNLSHQKFQKASINILVWFSMRKLVDIVARLCINSLLVNHWPVVALQVIELGYLRECIWRLHLNDKKQTLSAIAYCIATDCIVTERPIYIAIVRIAIRFILESASGPDKILDVSEIWSAHRLTTECRWSLDL